MIRTCVIANLQIVKINAFDRHSHNMACITYMTTYRARRAMSGDNVLNAVVTAAERELDSTPGYDHIANDNDYH